MKDVWREGRGTTNVIGNTEKITDENTEENQEVVVTTEDTKAPISLGTVTQGTIPSTTTKDSTHTKEVDSQALPVDTTDANSTTPTEALEAIVGNTRVKPQDQVGANMVAMST